MKPFKGVHDEEYLRLDNRFGHDAFRLPGKHLAGGPTSNHGNKKGAFSSMHAILHMMPKEGLDASTNAYWDSTDTRIMDVLHPMASAETLEAARAHFMDFSLILIEAVEKIGIAGDTPVYQLHCPMARNNKGADWLQQESDLANPYFGKAMPTCGELVRKLKT